MNTDNAYRDAVALSLPRERTVRGYLIRRMPIGQFLTALQALRDAPGELLDALLPGLTPQTLPGRLKALSAQELKAAATRLLTTLPAYGVRLIAGLIGVEEADLLRDELIGLDGLAEMLEAWAELNGLENCTRAAGALWDKVRASTTPAGCKDSLQER